MGDDYIASGSEVFDLKEYWRFYQSGQFVYLFAIREAVGGEYHDLLVKTLKSRTIDHPNWDEMRGTIAISSILQFPTATLTLATRMAELGIFDGRLSIEINLRHALGLVLATDPSRMWHSFYISRSEAYTKRLEPSLVELVANSNQLALETSIFFYHSFGWFNPPEKLLQDEQQRFLSNQMW